ncbi:DnaB-like helicase N-terminal domain-containing protein [Streptomyces chartreusis]|uniref:DnaB-like helicase N-terminal domain-containing protein n=1 Tax=Streptomyces chartreusis TaxID=1969 RepID=UPI00371C5DDA
MSMEPEHDDDTSPVPFERVPPQDLEAEQSVLGGMLLSRDAIAEVARILTSGTEFYKPAHETIFCAILAVYARGAEKPDPITVAAELTRSGDIGRIGGASYLHTLVQTVPTAANAEYYAEIIAELAARRGGIEEATRTIQALYKQDGDATEILENGVERMKAVRDRGMASSDKPSKTLRTFLAEADDEPDWIIPGVIARWDRLIVTAPEGGGKSLFNRQLLARTAAGLHPWKKARIAPKRVLLVDVENSESQVRPWLRRMHRAACEELGSDAEALLDNFVVEVIDGGVDLRHPGDRARLLRLVERNAPDMIAIGPLYKMAAGNPNDEEVARDLMSALEAVRVATNGAAMLIEAHAPHRAGGERQRDLRPIGSSLWLRWPEYGFGLAPISNKEIQFAEEEGLVRWQPWRGSRSERDWPAAFMRGATWPWQSVSMDDLHEPAALTVDVPAQQGALG